MTSTFFRYGHNGGHYRNLEALGESVRRHKEMDKNECDGVKDFFMDCTKFYLKILLIVGVSIGYGTVVNKYFPRYNERVSSVISSVFSHNSLENKLK